MRLGDIELTPRQAAAFTRWLDKCAVEYDRFDREVANRAEREAHHEQCMENLATLARETARQTGHVTGVRDHDLARVAWQAFVDNEGDYTTYDVDEHWSPSGDDYETWESAFLSELEKMGR